MASPDGPADRWTEQANRARDVARQRDKERREKKIADVKQRFRDVFKNPFDRIFSKEKVHDARSFDPSTPLPTHPPLPEDLDPLGHVAVIGAGVSGLATAFRLKQAGIGVTIFDQGEPGGTVKSYFEDGFVWESAMHNMEDTPAVQSLVTDLGLQDAQLWPHSNTAVQHVVRPFLDFAE
ncbi:hypothetical protein CYMTET_17020 [Cymbomonas tetramitiformis]|uniref:Uncharacterized protein n=1 Tax=Cymbomonas tetramitiformis TaxID=36881 RepID=A0AAE0GB09_9CHLO|nr:hypothetical protein CYMTET_17020 [Cymbomonas tetramitiformis]